MLIGDREEGLLTAQVVYKYTFRFIEYRYIISQLFKEILFRPLTFTLYVLF